MTTAVSKLTAAVALLLGASAAFAAAPGVDSHSVSVRYDDLNLSTEAGVSALYQRLSGAARQVCPDAYSRDLSVVIAAGRCKADAVSKAVDQINNPNLAMLHAARVSHG